LVGLLSGCDKQSPVSAGAKANGKKFYWVQPMKGHPVHQMTQIGFGEGCKKLGYQYEIIGTDSSDVAGTIALAEQALAKGDAAGIAIWTGSLPGILSLRRSARPACQLSCRTSRA